jgi:hypothetical protein
MNEPVNYIDPIGLQVKIYVIIETRTPTIIFGTRTGTTAEGTIIAQDSDTGKTVTARFFSGGKDHGEPIPNGEYDILSPNGKGHYRLEALDQHYGDDKVQGTNQGELRLHGKGSGRNYGCISIIDDVAWAEIDEMLSKTTITYADVDSKSRNPFKRDQKETLIKYGSLSVVDITDKPRISPPLGCHGMEY